MTNVLAIIPARGGSKGVPGKNLTLVGGVPLVVRAIDACRDAGTVTTVLVSTDDPAIAETSRAAGALVVARPAELSGDTASSESALLHALDEYESAHGAVDILVFVQATSPFITPAEVAAVTRAVRDGADTAFTAAPSHAFLWRRDADGNAVGVNHDKAGRPRRQDREAEFVETGAAYAMQAEGFRSHRHRFFGRTEIVATDPARVIDIDEPFDLERARALAPLFDRASDAQAGGDRS